MVICLKMLIVQKAIGIHYSYFSYNKIIVYVAL